MKSQVLYTVWCDISGEAARGNLTLITLRSERVNRVRISKVQCWNFFKSGFMTIRTSAIGGCSNVPYQSFAQKKIIRSFPQQLLPSSSVAAFLCFTSLPWPHTVLIKHLITCVRGGGGGGWLAHQSNPVGGRTNIFTTAGLDKSRVQ